MIFAKSSVLRVGERFERACVKYIINYPKLTRNIKQTQIPENIKSST